jgi:hypothetical protein
MDHYPAGSSTRAFVHFAQIYNNKGDFVKYDFGDPAQVEIFKELINLFIHIPVKARNFLSYS